VDHDSIDSIAWNGSDAMRIGQRTADGLQNLDDPTPGHPTKAVDQLLENNPFNFSVP